VRDATLPTGFAWTRLEIDLLLAQKIEVGVTAGTRIDDSRKIPGKIIGITPVDQRESKGNFNACALRQYEAHYHEVRNP
jgi:hypothetical protein